MAKTPKWDDSIGAPGDADKPGEEEELVGVAFANDRAEGEMIQGLLEQAGIRSALQPVGVDGPGLGFGSINPGGGSRRVLVRGEDSERARAALGEALAAGEQTDLTEAVDAPFVDAAERKPRSYGLIGAYARIFAWSFGTLVLAFALFALLRAT